MRILLVTYFGCKNGGGIATATRMLAEELKSRGHKIVIASVDRFEIEGVAWQKLPAVRKYPSFAWRDRILTNRLMGIMVKERLAEGGGFDVLHATDVRFVGGAALRAAQELSIPQIIDYRDYWFCCPKGDLLYRNNTLCTGAKSLDKCLSCLGRNKKNNLITKKNDFKIKSLKNYWIEQKYQMTLKRIEDLKTSTFKLPVSECVAKKMNDFGIKDNVVVMHDTYFIDDKKEMKIDSCENKDANEIVLTFAGKFIYHRGMKTMMEIARKISEKIPKVKLIMIGDGEMMNEVKDFLKDNNLNNVILTGQISSEQVLNYYQMTDIFIFPSLLEEPFSRAVLEAVFYEIPIIASDLGGLKEIVIDGQNGFLINPNDSEEIMGRIILLAENAGLRKKMAEKNRQLKVKYSPENYFDKLEKVYEQAILNFNN